MGDLAWPDSVEIVGECNMTKRSLPTRIRTIMLIVLLIPMLMLYSYWLVEAGRPYHSDFSHYWQASRMTYLGQSAYDSHAWEAVRNQYGITSSGTEATFLYPLPMVVLLIPFGLLTVEHAYFLWALLGGLSIFVSMLILISYYSQRTFVFEFLALGTVFLFRPTLYIIPGGQITAEFLLMLVLAIHFFGKQRWFLGGLAASMIVLKPSLGIPFLGLLGIWLLFKKQWSGIMGIAVGGILLYGLGAIYDPLWPLNYLAIGRGAFDKYYGYQPTILGMAGLMFKTAWMKTLTGVLGICTVLAVTGYYVWKKELHDNPFRIAAILTAVTLLISPYAWNYELVLLIIPILYILIAVSSLYGDLKAALFSLSILGFSVILFFVAIQQGYDVWSLLVTGTVWGMTLSLPKPVDAVLPAPDS